MKIFKENSYDIVKLYINQIGITIFSMFLYTAVAMIEDQVLFEQLRLVVSIFSILFYLSLIYNVVWEIGAKDKIRIDGGRMSPCKHKAFVMSIFANIPNFVLAGFAAIFVALGLLTKNDGLYSVFFIFYFILKFHSSMYMGCIQALTPNDPNVVDYNDCLIESILFIVFPLISIAVAHFSYQLGLKDKRLFAFFDGKPKKYE